MQLNNNFKFSHDPFGLVDFKKGIPFVPPKPPKSGLGWVGWLLIILIFGGIIYLGSLAYDYVKDDKKDSIKEPDVVPSYNFCGTRPGQPLSFSVRYLAFLFRVA